MAKAKGTREFVALVGINYPTADGEARVEAGERVSDLPAKSVSWLLSDGAIADATDAPSDAPADAPTDGEAA